MNLIDVMEEMRKKVRLIAKEVALDHNPYSKLYVFDSLMIQMFIAGYESGKEEIKAQMQIYKEMRAAEIEAKAIRIHKDDQANKNTDVILADSDIIHPYFFTPITCCCFKVRIENLLRINNILTLKDLVEKDHASIRCIPMLGVKSFYEIVEFLKSNNLQFKMTPYEMSTASFEPNEIALNVMGRNKK